MSRRCFGLAMLLACGASAQQRFTTSTKPARMVHVLVALADNRYQGIVPVPALIGNGDDPVRNLYWGAGYGLKTFLRKSGAWEPLGNCVPGRSPVLERCFFRHRVENVYVVADAYRGREIKRAMADFFAFAAGTKVEELSIEGVGHVKVGGASDLVAYVGHDGLMDFGLDHYEHWSDNRRREAVMLSCASKVYFADALRWTGAKPLLWTTGLMAPEAYVLEAVLAGWAAREQDGEIRRRAALAYDKYQHCGERAAMHLFATGW